MGIFDRNKKLNETIDKQNKILSEYEAIIKSTSLRNTDFMKLFGVTQEDDPLSKPYRQIPVLHACIKWKARNFAQVPFRLYQGEREVTSGPVYDLFQVINPTMDPFQFWEGLPTCLDYSGNAYIVFDEDLNGKLPAYLWLYNPNWITPAFDRSGAWVGWWLARPKKEKEFLEMKRVIQVKYYNPDNEILGLNPLEVLQVTNDTLWAAMKYNKNFFKNDATPQTVFTKEGDISARQAEELKQKMIEKKRGVAHAHEAMMLTGGWDVKTIGLSQKDLQFLEQMKLNREEISMVYGVPKKILGLYEDINMATAESAELQFWEDTIMPIASMVEFAFNKRLLNPLGYRGEFDFSVIDVLNKRVLEKVATVTALLSTGQFTRNELNQRFRLGFDNPKWGDEPIQMFTPIMGAAKEPEKKMLEFPHVEPKTIPLDEAGMGRKWAKLVMPIVPIMSKAAKATKDYFHSVERRIIATLAKKVDGNYTAKIPLGEVPIEDIEKAFSDEALYQALAPYLQDSVERGFKTIIQTGFRMDNAQAMAILAAKRIKVIEMNDTAKRQIVESMREVLKEGLEAGTGQDELARMLIDSFLGKMADIKRRAATIARTEVNSSFSQSRASALESDPPKKVRWITSNDVKVRDSHQSLSGKVVEWGQPFPNGLKFPMDPDGAAEEFINCRCTFEPLYFDEEN